MGCSVEHAAVSAAATPAPSIEHLAACIITALDNGACVAPAGVPQPSPAFVHVSLSVPLRSTVPVCLTTSNLLRPRARLLLAAGEGTLQHAATAQQRLVCSAASSHGWLDVADALAEAAGSGNGLAAAPAATTSLSAPRYFLACPVLSPDSGEPLASLLIGLDTPPDSPDSAMATTACCATGARLAEQLGSTHSQRLSDLAQLLETVLFHQSPVARARNNDGGTGAGAGGSGGEDVYSDDGYGSSSGSGGAGTDSDSEEQEVAAHGGRWLWRHAPPGGLWLPPGLHPLTLQFRDPGQELRFQLWHAGEMRKVRHSEGFFPAAAPRTHHPTLPRPPKLTFMLLNPVAHRWMHWSLGSCQLQTSFTYGSSRPCSCLPSCLSGPPCWLLLAWHCACPSRYFRSGEGLNGLRDLKRAQHRAALGFVGS